MPCTILHRSRPALTSHSQQPRKVGAGIIPILYLRETWSLEVALASGGVRLTSRISQPCDQPPDSGSTALGWLSVGADVFSLLLLGNSWQAQLKCRPGRSGEHSYCPIPPAGINLHRAVCNVASLTLCEGYCITGRDFRLPTHGEMRTPPTPPHPCPPRDK